MEKAKNVFQQIAEQLASAPCQPENTPEDEPVYDCAHCKDRQLYDKVSTGPLPSDFIMITALCPYCGERKRTERLWKYCGIPNEDKINTLKTFEQKTDVQKEGYQAILDVLGETSQVDIVLIYGPPGTGKSHLGTAAVIDWITRGKVARMIRCGEWLDELRYSFSDKTDKDLHTQKIKEHIYSPDYLVIDELSCSTDFEWRTLDEVIGRRYDRHRPTIVISNKDLPELQDKFSRIVSRSIDYLRGRQIVLDGEDYRERRR